MSTVSSVPVLDCANIIDGSLEEVENMAAFKEFTQKLGESISDIGFVYLVNHGIPSEVIDNVLRKSRNFFELPVEAKLKYRKIDKIENYHGYTTLEAVTSDTGNEIQVGPREWWDSWGFQSLDEVNYPQENPGFKDAIDSYKKSVAELSKKVFRGFADYLQLADQDFFITRHRALENWNIRSHNHIRCNYYQVLDGDVPVSNDTLRVAEHNDFSTITLLVQDAIGGLEARTTKGQWIPVPPIEGSILLNAGNMLALMTGGHFPSTVHRVRVVPDAVGQVRQSLVYFIEPDGDCTCLPALPDKEGWVPIYRKPEEQNHFDFFKVRIRLATSGVKTINSNS